MKLKQRALATVGASLVAGATIAGAAGAASAAAPATTAATPATHDGTVKLDYDKNGCRFRYDPISGKKIVLYCTV